MKNDKKFASIAVATLLAMTNNPAIAENKSVNDICGSDNQSASSKVSSGISDNSLARQKLVDALINMKNKPEEIEFHSAMCYKMAMPPDTFEYSCHECGQATTHQYQSPAGQLSRQIASVRRSLPNLPAKISVNSTSLCQRCGKGAAAELVFTTECGECKTSFTWKIASNDNLYKLEWLFLEYPFKSLDVGPGKDGNLEPERVKEMVEFVSGCIFCPKCINKLQLNYQK